MGLVEILLIIIGMLVLSLDPHVNSFETSLSAMASCLNNIGPGFGSLSSNFGGLNILSKITLILSMLIGRLEIFPILILFSPKIWKKN